MDQVLTDVESENAQEPLVIEADEKTVRNRAKNKVGFGILLGVALVILVVFLTNLTGTRADLNALKRMGVPMDESGVERLSPQTGDNAAPIYESAQEDELDLRLARAQINRSGLVGFFPRMTNDFQRDVIIESAKQAEPLADMYREAAAMPRFVEGIPYVDSDEDAETAKFDPGLRGYRLYVNPTNLLCGMAHAEMLQGQKEQSIRDLDFALQTVNQTAANPTSEAFEAWNIEQGQFHRNVLACLQINGGDREVVEGVARVLQEDFRLPILRNIPAGDFPMARDIYDAAQKDPDGYKLHVMLSSSDNYESNKMLMRQAVDQTIHEWRKVFEALPKDPNDWRSYDDAFIMGSEDMRSRWPEKDLILDPFHSYSAETERWAAALATHRLAIAACNLLLYRLDHGSLPDTLPDYGVNSIDPFSGQPLVYERDGSGFKITSVGMYGLNSALKQQDRNLREIVYTFDAA